MKKNLGTKFVLFVIYAVIALIDMASNIAGLIPGIGDIAKALIDLILNTFTGILILYIMFVLKR